MLVNHEVPLQRGIRGISFIPFSFLSFPTMKRKKSILRLSENQTNLFAWLNVSKITEGKEKSPLQKKIGKEEYFAKTQNSSFYSLRL